MTVNPVTFDPALWRPYYLFLSDIPEFLADIGVDCNKVDPGPPPSGYPENEIAEVVRLRSLVDNEPDRRVRILDQDRGFPEFFKAFGLTYQMVEDKFPWVHAATFKLPIELSRPVLLKLKKNYNIARPWQLAPNLHPVVPNPGHPAYPGGHSCQTLLAIDMIKLVMPKSMLTATVVNFIENLTTDVGINREYAGLHYASDTAAGRQLAQNMMPYIQKRFAELIAGAQEEALGI